MERNVIIKRSFITLAIIVALASLFIFNRLISGNPNEEIFTKVEEGLFEITVKAAGELIAENSVEIMGPSLPQQNNRNMRGGRGRSRMRVTDLEIADIIPEGTIVKTGDYIAQLDRTEYDNQLKDQQENLKTLQTNLDMKILDTSVVLTNLRDGIKNQQYAVEEATILLNQSMYEPPTVIRQAEISLDRENRKLNQLKRSYELKRTQQIRQLNNTRTELQNQEELIRDLETYLEGFTIYAPSPGMVIYKKNRNGTKREVGSTLSPFDLVVATLPDLSAMISKTYVSEIDVNKVMPGQKVKITVDALPDKQFTATVLSVGKIGEQLPNSDSKMFEVQSRLDEYDPDLRPSMTTGNEIIIRSYKDVEYVPLECVRAGADDIPFVYTKNRTKQIVLLGEANDKNVIVEEGLEPGTSVYITPPENPEKFRTAGEELIPSIYKEADVADISEDSDISE